MRPAILTLLVVILVPAIGNAGVIHVPGDYGTIQEAIDAALGGDTVLVDPGTYVENLDFLGKAITVRSDGDGDPATHDLAVATTIVDGNLSGSVVVFDTWEGPDSVLEGFTLTNGSGSSYAGWNLGGGVVCVSSSPTIRHNDIRANSAGVGGGVAYVIDAAGVLADNLIRDNNASVSCGGIGMTDGCTPSIVDNVIAGNSTDGPGGGIYCHDSSSPRIEGNLFVDNESGTFGGGIACWYLSSPEIVDNVVAFNRATNGGGLGLRYLSRPVLSGNTIYGNEATEEGGGIYCEQDSRGTITNTIFWNDSAPRGPEIRISLRSRIIIGYSDVEGGEAAVDRDSDSYLTWESGMIEVDPLLVDPDGPDDVPATWQDNDLSLLASSPCIDVGNPVDLPGGRDAVGFPRLLDGDLDRVMGVDMGACEFDHVRLAVSGDFTPGGTMTIDTSGTAGLQVLLFAGTAPGEVLIRPYGSFFVSFASPRIMLPWGTISDPPVILTLPPGLPTPLPLFLQELAYDPGTMAGNLSNDVSLTIE